MLLQNAQRLASAVAEKNKNLESEVSVNSQSSTEKVGKLEENHQPTRNFYC
jgi:hypothetical protein